MGRNTFSIRNDDKKNVSKICLCFKKMPYFSKNNSDHEKQVILLMIPNEEKHKAKSEGQQWHYLAVKKISALLRRKHQKNNDDFY